MITLKKDAKLTPGTWIGGKRKSDIAAVSICCPNGHIAGLDGHTINEDGEVDPSLICTWSGCDFHDHVYLEGWKKSVQKTAPGKRN